MRRRSSAPDVTLCAVCLVAVATACGSETGIGSTHSTDDRKSGGGSSGGGSSGGGSSGGGSSGGGSSSSSGGSVSGKGGQDGGGTASGGMGSGGSATGGVASTGGQPELPVGPPWVPPFPVGTPGWRQSTEPFCPERYGPARGVQLWSDKTTVFAAFNTSCPIGHKRPCSGDGTSLYQNAGSGWQRIPTGDALIHSGYLGGFPGGHLVTHGPGISLVDRDGDAFGEDWVPSLAGDEVYGFSTASPLSTYALTRSGRLLTFGAERWYDFAGLGDGKSEWTALHTTGTSTFAVGTGARVARITPGGGVEALPDAPKENEMVWAFADDDVWTAGLPPRLAHFDGSGWETVELPITSTLDRIWGSPEGTLFFVGPHHFGRVKDGKVEVLLAPPATSTADGSKPLFFTSLWGNSENEVFIGIDDKAWDEYRCSGAFVLYFDGETVHLF